MEEHNYTVYMHKNKINGKVYIGITKRKPQYRWNNGKGIRILAGGYHWRYYGE